MVSYNQSEVRIPDLRTPGRYYDHVGEWQQKLGAIRKHVDTLKKCDDPAAKQAVKDAEVFLKKMEDAISGLGL